MKLVIGDLIQLSRPLIDGALLFNRLDDNSQTWDSWKDDPDKYRRDQGFQTLNLQRPSPTKALLLKLPHWYSFVRRPDGKHTLVGAYSVEGSPQFHHKSTTGEDVFWFFLRNLPEWDHLLGRIVVDMELKEFCMPWVHPAFGGLAIRITVE
jgi:hypothetical protein